MPTPGRISKALRFQILRRDNHTCRYCGATAPEATLVIDHVIPVTLGGQTVPENLAAACQSCNQGKSSTPPDAHHIADVQADAVRWSRAMRAAADLQLQQRWTREQYISGFDDTWMLWTWGPDKQPVPRPSDWRDSIIRWAELGLELELITDFVRTAMTKPRLAVDEVWRYFCGICWSTLRKRTEMAREFLAAEESDP